MNNSLIFGQSPTFSNLIKLAEQYAQQPWSILILGETGVGKELVARRIHSRSPQGTGNFIPVNCGAIPPSLFESELFGYERGAFSGAFQNYKGLIRQAQGGTIFLDEIGELDLNSQVKLLRFLDSGEIRSIGSLKPQQIQLRVIAATNVNLVEALHCGNFRRDLLERLSILTLSIPPLRSRKEDIIPLARYFASQLGSTISELALNRLCYYDWSGNVRELRNIVIRASVMSYNNISLKEIELLLTEQSQTLKRAAPSSKHLPIEGTLADIEKRVIVERLKHCHGNRKMTAEELGIAKSTLHEKIRRWKKDAPEPLAWPLSKWTSDSSNYPACNTYS